MLHNCTTKLGKCPTKQNERKTKHISLFIQPSLVNIITEAATKKNIPVSRLIRSAIEQYAEQVL